MVPPPSATTDSVVRGRAVKFHQRPLYEVCEFEIAHGAGVSVPRDYFETRLSPQQASAQDPMPDGRNLTMDDSAVSRADREACLRQRGGEQLTPVLGPPP